MRDEQRRVTIVYLRGVPRQLVREAKAVAARRGITLTALVSEALAEVVKARVPEDERNPNDSLQADMAWYQLHKPKLLRRYNGEYVAIVGQKVIDHSNKFAPLARRLFTRFGSGHIFMPKVVSGERIANIPSPRVVRG